MHTYRFSPGSWQFCASPFYLTKGTGLLWFRLLGHGLSVTNTRVRPPAFSIRYGYRRSLKLGPFVVELL